MKVIYVTLNVLGDAGANAAELFPKLAVAAPVLDQVIVADKGRNRDIVLDRQGAEFLRLRGRGWWPYRALRNGLRIARKARDARIDVIHVFYRQSSIPLVVALRLGLIVLRCPARVLVDHRSVNLAHGWRRWIKIGENLMMQPFAHHLAGNPKAVETNHPVLLRPRHIIDLGYDRLPPEGKPVQGMGQDRAIWFIGSMKPANRKSEFLIDVFDRIARAVSPADGIRIHVAGPARPDQIAALVMNPVVDYYGKLPRTDLYALLQGNPGIGIAFMNRAFHEYAPSLKFCEYAIMRFAIVASDTVGLRLQAERMNLEGVTFLREDPDVWAAALLDAARNRTGPGAVWADSALWSYDSIFNRQVIPLYETIRPRP